MSVDDRCLCGPNESCGYCRPTCPKCDGTGWVKHLMRVAEMDRDDPSSESLSRCECSNVFCYDCKHIKAACTCRAAPATLHDAARHKPKAQDIIDKIAAAKQVEADRLYTKYETRVWTEIRLMYTTNRDRGDVRLDRDADRLGERLERELKEAGYTLTQHGLTVIIHARPEVCRDD